MLAAGLKPSGLLPVVLVRHLRVLAQCVSCHTLVARCHAIARRDAQKAAVTDREQHSCTMCRVSAGRC